VPLFRSDLNVMVPASSGFLCMASVRPLDLNEIDPGHYSFGSEKKTELRQFLAS
jgi:hypothetical protein